MATASDEPIATTITAQSVPYSSCLLAGLHMLLSFHRHQVRQPWHFYATMAGFGLMSDNTRSKAAIVRCSAFA